MPEATESPPTKRSSVPANLIGNRLRLARQEQKLSLRALAAKVGVTASLLSQIETGQVNPSVDTLFALAEGLNVPTCYFFGDDMEHAQHAEVVSAVPDRVIVHPRDRRSVELAQGVVWESLLPAEEADFEWMEIHYPPHSVSAQTMQRHGGRDYFIVLQGRLTVQLAFVSHQLESGDSIAFDGTIPHQLRNEGSELVRAIVAVLQRHEVAPGGLGPRGYHS